MAVLFCYGSGGVKKASPLGKCCLAGGYVGKSTILNNNTALIKKLEISYIIVNEKYWEEVYYRVYTSKSVMLMMIGYKEEQCQGIL